VDEGNTSSGYPPLPGRLCHLRHAVNIFFNLFFVQEERSGRVPVLPSLPTASCHLSVGSRVNLKSDDSLIYYSCQRDEEKEDASFR